MALLDTTVLIDLSRRPSSPLHIRAVQAISALVRAGETLSTSRINEAELRVGVFRSTEPARELAKVDAVLSMLPIHEFDSAAAERYALARARSLDEGRPRGQLDLLIAAVALAAGEPLLTRNPAHFDGIVDLRVLRY